jgi:hypothetical protein
VTSGVPKFRDALSRELFVHNSMND